MVQREQKERSVARESVGKDEVLRGMLQDGTVNTVFQYAQKGGAGGGFEQLRKSIEMFARGLYDSDLSEEEAEEKMNVYRHSLEMLHNTFVSLFKVSQADDPRRSVPPFSLFEIARLKQYVREQGADPDDETSDLGDVVAETAGEVKGGSGDAAGQEEQPSSHHETSAMKEGEEGKERTPREEKVAEGVNEEDESPQEEAEPEPVAESEDQVPESDVEGPAPVHTEDEPDIEQDPLTELQEKHAGIEADRKREMEEEKGGMLRQIQAKQEKLRSQSTAEVARKEQLKQVEKSLSRAEQELSYLARAHGDLQAQHESALTAVATAREDFEKKQEVLNQEKKRQQDLEQAEQKLANIQREAQRDIEKARQELARVQREAEQVNVSPNQRRVFTVLHPLIVANNEKTTALLGCDAKWGQVLADQEEEARVAREVLQNTEKEGQDSDKESADRLARAEKALAESREMSQKEIADIEKEIADIQEKAGQEGVDLNSQMTVEQTAQTLLEPEAIAVKEKTAVLHEREADWEQRQVATKDLIDRIKEEGAESGGEEEAVEKSRHILEDAERKALHVSDMMQEYETNRSKTEEEIEQLKDKKERIDHVEEEIVDMLDKDLSDAQSELEQASFTEKLKQAYQSFSEMNLYDKNVLGVRHRIDARKGKTAGILKFMARQASVRNVITALLGFGTGAVGSPAFIAWTAGLGAVGGGITAESFVATREEKAEEQKLENFLETFENQKSVRGGTFAEVMTLRNDYLAFVRQQGGDVERFLQKPAYVRLESIYQHLLQQEINLKVEAAKNDLNNADRVQKFLDLVESVDHRREVAFRKKGVSKRQKAFLFGAVIGGAAGFVLRDQAQDLYSALSGVETPDTTSAPENKVEISDSGKPEAEGHEAELSADLHTVQKGDRLFTILEYEPEQQSSFVQKWSQLSAKEKIARLKEFGMRADVRNLGDAPNYIEIGDTINKQAVQEFLSGTEGVSPAESEATPSQPDTAAAEQNQSEVMPNQKMDEEMSDQSMAGIDETVSSPAPDQEPAADLSEPEEGFSADSEEFAAILQEVAGNDLGDVTVSFQKGGTSLENVSLADFKPWFSSESGWSDRLASLPASADVVRGSDGSIETLVIDLGEGKAANGISFSRPDESMVERFITSVSEEKKDLFDLKGDGEVPVSLVAAVESVLKIAMLDHAGNATLMNEAVPELAKSIVEERQDPQGIISILQKAEGATVSGGGKYFNLVRQSSTAGEIILGSADISRFAAL